MADGYIAIDLQLKNRDFKNSLNSTVGMAKTGMHGVSSAAVAAGAVMAQAFTAAASAIADIGRSAVELYAQFEQLDGGAKLMFGDAYDYVIAKSEEAYKTVQMSQNEYLKQANGFATGLKTALGGDIMAAAELADRIITAEADVVAATGASADSVQNAFNGIMKSNYTMLDNLQIGITPTKEGFQELIGKVNEWNASNGRMTSYTIENLADCQSALVDYVEMVGMSGYASAEASDTVEGSVASMKAAWSNWMTGMGKSDSDMEKLTKNLMDTTSNALRQVTPIVAKIVTTAFSEIPGYMPELAAGVWEAFSTQLSNAGINNPGDLVAGIFQAWLNVLDMVGDYLTAENVYNLLSSLGGALMDAAESGQITELFNAGLSIGGQIIAGVLQAVGEGICHIPELIGNAISGGNYDKYVDNQISALEMEYGITMNADGGIFNKATLLGNGNVVGEAGSEAVIPLTPDVLAGIGKGIRVDGEGQVVALLQQLVSMVGGGIPVSVDARSTARTLMPEINRQMGGRLA